MTLDTPYYRPTSFESRALRRGAQLVVGSLKRGHCIFFARSLVSTFFEERLDKDTIHGRDR